MKKFIGQCCFVAMMLLNLFSSKGFAQDDFMATQTKPDTLIVHTTLNMVDKGEHFVQLLANHDILIERNDLKDMGLIAPFPNDHGKSEWVSLKAMGNLLSYHLDIHSGELSMQADTLLLPKHTKTLKTQKSSDAVFIQDHAMFLNYDANYRQARYAPSNINIPLELGMNWQGLSFINQLNWQTQQTLQRTQTQLVYDKNDSLQRWVLGDIHASAGNRIGGATLGGIRVYKNYGLMPGIFLGPPLSLKANLLTPSEVEVRIDGQMIYRDKFQPGELNLQDIPYYRSGLGKAEIMIRDAFGRETVLKSTYYASTQLLAPGLHAYDYAMGVEQKKNLFGKLSYARKALFYGSHRYGLFHWLTPGFGLENQGRNIRGGLTVDMLLGQWGQLNMLVAASQRQGLRGHNIQVDYTYSSDSFFSNQFFFSTTTSRYGGVLDPSTQSTSANRWVGGTSLSFSFQQLGSWTWQWEKSQHFDSLHAQTASLLFSSVLPKQITISSQLKRSWLQATAPSNQINVSLGTSLKNGLYLSANYSRDHHNNTFGLQLQMSAPRGKGYGYSVDARSSAGSPATALTRLQYNGDHAELELGRSGSSKLPTYSARLSGSLLLTKEGIHTGRPIRDAFALLKVKEMPHVKVSVHHQIVGETDKHGELLLPYMNAYSDNTISIDTSAIPLGYQVDHDSVNVTSSYRGGGIINFPVAKIHVIGGKVFYKNHEKLESAQYSGLEIMVGDRKKTVVIGYGGEIYIENMKAGKYSARLFNAFRSCQFILTIPESDEIIQDIGNVVCKLNQQEEEHDK